MRKSWFYVSYYVSRHNYFLVLGNNPQLIAKLLVRTRSTVLLILIPTHYSLLPTPFFVSPESFKHQRLNADRPAVPPLPAAASRFLFPHQ